MDTKLFVGGISWNTTEDTLKAYFEKVGKVVEVRILKDKYTGKSRGYGFVEMGSTDLAKAAIAELHGTTLDDRELKVDHANPMTEDKANQKKQDKGDPRSPKDFHNN